MVRGNMIYVISLALAFARSYSLSNQEAYKMGLTHINLGGSPAQPTNTTCDDIITSFKWNNDEMVDCSWVAINSDIVCSQVIAKNNCPKSCDTCSPMVPVLQSQSVKVIALPDATPFLRSEEEPQDEHVSESSNEYRCADTASSFRWMSDNMVDCKWVASHLDIACSQVIARAHCPKACDSCLLTVHSLSPFSESKIDATSPKYQQRSLSMWYSMQTAVPTIKPSLKPTSIPSASPTIAYNVTVVVNNAFKLVNVTIPSSPSEIETMKNVITDALSVLYPPGSVITIISIGSLPLGTRRLVSSSSDSTIYYVVTLPSLSCNSPAQCQSLALQSVNSAQSNVLKYTDNGVAEEAFLNAAKEQNLVYLLGMQIDSGSNIQLSNCGQSISINVPLANGSPASMPTAKPSVQGTTVSCEVITAPPTARPSASPTRAPTSRPTLKPSTRKPSSKPMLINTSKPTSKQSFRKPSSKPTLKTTSKPTRKPSSITSGKPTATNGLKPTPKPISIKSGKPMITNGLKPTPKPTSIKSGNLTVINGLKQSAKPKNEAAEGRACCL